MLNREMSTPQTEGAQTHRASDKSRGRSCVTVVVFMCVSVLCCSHSAQTIVSMPKPKQDTTVLTLRQRFRDEGCEPSWRPDPSKVNIREYLTFGEMTTVLQAIQIAKDGKRRHRGAVKELRNVGHAFWAGHPLDAEVTLPGDAQIGARSCLLLAGMEIIVWTYGKVHGLPDGVIVKSADGLLPLGETESLVARGLRIQHLSDIVRFRGIEDSRTRLYSKRAVCQKGSVMGFQVGVWSLM